jgi:hypothetical protein
MALSQIEIIKSLGKSLEWLETELSWGSPAAELRHLTGRIGELYVAMITLGQLADSVNQRGYDVISNTGERISVKTITSSQHVAFNKNTIEHVDRVMILKINTEDMQIEILYDFMQIDFQTIFKEYNGKYIVSFTGKNKNENLDFSKLSVIGGVDYMGYRVEQLENASIQIYKNNQLQSPSKPILRTMAKVLNINEMNSMGNLKNTRTLGDNIIKMVRQINKNEDEIE